MHPFALLWTLVLTLLHVTIARASEVPELNVITTFPNNPFSSALLLTVVQNGQANRVVFTISKPSSLDRALSVEGITGAFIKPAVKEGAKTRVLRNVR